MPPVGARVQNEPVTAAEWEPFGLDDEERSDYAVLLDGVPSWMREELLDWLRGRVLEKHGWANVAFCLNVQTSCRVDLGVRAAAVSSGEFPMNALRAMLDQPLLRVVDFVLAERTVYGTDQRQKLEGILRRARSKWTVGERMGKPGLVERVPRGVQDAVEGTIASAGLAGQVLARAWSDVHGLQPKPSNAYSYAVRAVEIAAIAAVQPRKLDATLGTVLGQMKADGDWRLCLREHGDAPGPELLLAMMRTLWFGHRDRHGSADYSDVGQEEARAAVMLAAGLVEWIAAGLITRRPL